MTASEVSGETGRAENEEEKRQRENRDRQKQEFLFALLDEGTSLTICQ